MDNDLVFASATGTPLDSAGLDAADWTPRELRHNFVSVLFDAGVPIEQIARLVGRTSGSTVTETLQMARVVADPVLSDALLEQGITNALDQLGVATDRGGARAPESAPSTRAARPPEPEVAQS